MMLNNSRVAEAMCSSYSILVADDDEELREILSGQLEDDGYHVATAADGDEAILLISDKRFDLVLLDISMQRANGLEVLEFIKRDHPPVYAIMLTGNTDLKNAIESKRLGADGFIGKPFDMNDILTSIRRILT